MFQQTDKVFVCFLVVSDTRRSREKRRWQVQCKAKTTKKMGEKTLDPSNVTVSFQSDEKKTNSRHEWKLEYEDDVGNFNIQKNLLTHLKRQTVPASRRFTCVGLMDSQLEDFLVQFHTWLQHKNVNQLQLYSTYTTSTSSRGLWAFFAAVCFERATINEMWNDLPIKRRSFTVNWAFNMLNKHIFMLNVVFNGTARVAAALSRALANSTYVACLYAGLGSPHDHLACIAAASDRFGRKAR